MSWKNRWRNCGRENRMWVQLFLRTRFFLPVAHWQQYFQDVSNSSTGKSIERRARQVAERTMGIGTNRKWEEECWSRKAATGVWVSCFSRKLFVQTKFQVFAPPRFVCEVWNILWDFVFRKILLRQHAAALRRKSKQIVEELVCIVELILDAALRKGHRKHFPTSAHILGTVTLTSFTRIKAVPLGERFCVWGMVLKRLSSRTQRKLSLNQEQDQKWLDQLIAAEARDVRAQEERRERARADARWMRQVLADQIKVEKQREAELDLFYQWVERNFPLHPERCMSAAATTTNSEIETSCVNN